MKFILGTKIAMTRVFANGISTPVTLVQAGPMTVTQVRTKEKDGYDAVQVGFGERNEKRLSRAVRGHLKELGSFRWLREFRITNQDPGITELERGRQLDASVFEPGDLVKISAVSKGKGFAGVVKRHGFHGGPRSHGQKHSEREPGSISTGRIQTVRKGKRMAGRMGGERVTVEGLTVVEVDKEKNLIVVKGAVPGRKGALVEVRGE
ncbi:MAG: 50S ribosomal protein L3 [bacterium]|nr:50S ribosomal protein L3 [bacterium]MDZ4295894.1 50S ribosomal protein L3 [Patescibacteria group bacterium]